MGFCAKISLMSKNAVRYPQGNVLLRNLSKNYPVISHGKGVYLYDTTGKDYIDASGGAMVVSIGHGNDYVAQKILEQALKVSYVNGQHFTSDAMEAFAEKLVKYFPKSLNRVAVLSSGSEANEAAFKFMRQLCFERGQSERTKFIARSPGYHGNTLFALSASARPSYKKCYGPLLSEVLMVEAPYEYRSPVTHYHRDGAQYYAKQLDELIQKEGPETIAAFVFEPIIGSSAGGSCPPDGYFEAIKNVCQKYGVLMMADEVLCGSGRTGKFLACEHYNIEPDVLVLGKGINGGMIPVSCLVVKEEHLNEIKQGSGNFMHAQTYLQSPLLAACGLAVLDYFDKENLLAKCTQQGTYLHQSLKTHIAPLQGVGFITGKGLLAGVEFVEDKNTKKPFDRSKKVAENMVQRGMENGIILWPNVGQADQTNGDIVMIAPPLNIEKKEIDILVERLKTTIQAVIS